MNRKSSDAVEILKRRLIGEDKRRHASLERELLNAEVARQVYEARTKAGLNQSQLAKLVGTTQSVISRLEDADYGRHSLNMLSRIADALGQKLSVVFLDGQVAPRPPDAAGDGDTDDVSGIVDSCPANEMRRRDWLPSWETLDELREHLRGFFGARPRQIATHRRQSGPDNPNETALMCWATKLEIEAGRIDVPRFSAKRLKERLPELVHLSAMADGPVKAVEWLESNGVRCLFIRHLPKTYLDGAAALLGDGSPCIGLTLRHDRLDNFWFSLLHEIGHVLLHRNQLLSHPILDEEIEKKPDDKREEQADRFARNSWVKPKRWRQFRRKSPTFPSSSAVRIFADRLQVTPALVAGRLRYDLKQYHPYHEFLGANTVNRLIEREYPVF